MTVSGNLWKRLALFLALVKVGAGLVALYLVFDKIKSDPTYPGILHLVYGAPFAATGILLITSGRRDPRAINLGGFFLMAATAFLNRPLRTCLELGYPGARLMQAVDVLELDAFMAFFLWSFARDFPHPLISPAGQRNIRWAVEASLVAGLILFGLNLINYFVLLLLGFEPLPQLVPMRGHGIFYSVLLPPVLAAFGFLIWRGYRLRGEEQRRVRLFLLGFGLLAVPTLVEILVGLFFPPYREFIDARPWLGRNIILVQTLFVVMLPVLTPYAVLVHQVLDVKLLARRVLQYALARYSVMALAAVPMTFLAGYLYENREEKLVKFFTGPQLPLLGSVALIGLAALRYRRTLLEAIDRRYFREQYDARRILTQLQDRIRASSGTAALASLIAHEVDLALHLEGISVLVLDSRCGVLNDPRNRGRRLDASSHLALLVANNSDPLMIDLADSRSPLARLPNEDRHWLVDSGFRMIVPVLARDGSLLGLIGLGEKRSGLPFLKEDRDLLHAIASSAAWIIELEQTGTPPRSKRPKRVAAVLEVEEDDTVAEPISLTETEMAKECPNCNRLYPSYTVLCSACSKRLEVSHVPYVLPGKFRFEKRVGIGGMGVVYRGSDLALGRQVAVKTLRRVSPEDAMRLRREARTAAAVSHPHLAPVYGMETWQGTPMLVLELLEGGTLAHRLLEHGRLTPVETIDLGMAMCDALGQLHAADILHRDIKPSNIGYNRDGVPKLMDFGIARMMYDLRREREGGDRERLEEDPSQIPSSSIWTPIDGITPRSKPLVGTLSYLCPEALEGRTPDSLFDLWSLAIVLYECLLGRKVFSSSDPRQTAARIRVGRVPDLRQLCPEYEEPLAEFFRIALHRSRSRRPTSAQELRHSLEGVRAKLA